jgi:hypothetical protein
MPFTKVVEECKIYNFPIHTMVHCSSKFRTKTRSKEAWLKWFAPYCSRVCARAGVARRRAAVLLGPHAEAGRCPLVRALWNRIAHRLSSPLLSRHTFTHAALTTQPRRRRTAPRRPASYALSYACTTYVPIPRPTVGCVRAKSPSTAIRSPKLPLRARSLPLALSATTAIIGALGELHPPVVLPPNPYYPYLHQDSL